MTKSKIDEIKEKVKLDENNNKYYSSFNSYDVVKDVEYLLSYIEKLENACSKLGDSAYAWEDPNNTPGVIKILGILLPGVKLQDFIDLNKILKGGEK